MGKSKSRRPSLKMASVIRKKAKAKRAHDKKEAKTKQYPKRTKKMLKAPQSMPFREIIEAQVHESSAFLNNVLRPIESTRVEDKSHPYDRQLLQMKAEIADKHREMKQAAIDSFQALTQAIEQADAVIQVLDARDPYACRLCEAENEVMTAKKKPMIIIINKIDLVPREAAIGWIAALKTIAPTIAVSAINQNSSMAVIRDVIQATAPTAKKIAVIGIANVGKSSICQFNPELFIEVPSYKFITATADVALLKGAEFIDSFNDFAVEIMSRKADDDLFLALEIAEQETPKDVITVLSKKWQLKPYQASQKFVELFVNGQILFCSVPPTSQMEGMEQSQIAALQPSLTAEMSGKVYAHLQKGDTIVLNNKLLGIENEDDDEENENEDNDNDEEEDGEESKE